jgi:hypothetical protein
MYMPRQAIYADCDDTGLSSGYVVQAKNRTNEMQSLAKDAKSSMQRSACYFCSIASERLSSESGSIQWSWCSA